LADVRPLLATEEAVKLDAGGHAAFGAVCHQGGVDGEGPMSPTRQKPP
jgi:hypothetical protein